MKNKINRELSLKALIVREKKILLLKPRILKRSIGGWDGPGGHVMHGETLKEALVREVFEETKLKVKRFLPIKILTIPPNKTTYLIFLCTVFPGKVILSKEHTAFKWVNLKQLESLTKINLTKELLEIKKIMEKLI